MRFTQPVPLHVNHETVPDHVLDEEVLRLSSGLEMDAPQAGNSDPAALRSLALETIIERTLLLQLATARAIEVAPNEVEQELRQRWQVQRNGICDPGAMNRLRDSMRIERVRAVLTRHIPRPGRFESEQHYRSHLHQYRQAEAVEAAHIFCGFNSPDEEPAAQRRILQAKAELAQGRSFAQVADRYSDCRGVGGAVGWVARGVMVSEFEEVVFALHVGAQSDIFRTVFGFHIARCLRRRAAGLVPLDQVRLGIARHLHNKARNHAVQQVLAQMKARSIIRYTEEKVVG